MKYEEYKKIMRSADSKGLLALIKFAMKNPGAPCAVYGKVCQRGERVIESICYLA